MDYSKYGCDGPVSEDWYSHWFIMKDEPVLLGRGFEFVDAGDYDADGSSEVLFWYSGYNYDGYTLFYQDFTKCVHYRWDYH